MDGDYQRRTVASARGGHTSLHQRYGAETPVRQTEKADELTSACLAERVKAISRFVRNLMRYSMTGEAENEDES